MAQRSVEDDVDYLRSVAEAGASAAPSSGKYFLVWSIVVATGLLITYGAVTSGVPIKPEQLNYAWGSVLAVGWIVSFLFGRVDGAKPETVRFANRLTAAVWLAVGVSLTVVWVGLAASGVANQAIMMPIGAAVFGVATVVSAILFRIAWLYAIAAAWWAVALGSFFILERIEFILFSAAVILLLQGGTGLALMIHQRRRAA